MPVISSPTIKYKIKIPTDTRCYVCNKLDVISHRINPTLPHIEDNNIFVCRKHHNRINHFNKLEHDRIKSNEITWTDIIEKVRFEAIIKQEDECIIWEFGPENDIEQD